MKRVLLPDQRAAVGRLRRRGAGGDHRRLLGRRLRRQPDGGLPQAVHGAHRHQDQFGRCRQPGDADQGAGRGRQRHHRHRRRGALRMLVRLCDEGAARGAADRRAPGGRRRHPGGRGLHRRRALRLRRRRPSSTRPSSPIDSDKFPRARPSAADFFDLEKFPGKRGLRKGAKSSLELALMADGVPAAEVYELLATPEGVDRAFAKLDTIKDEVIWWEAGAQPPQLLADGEVVMTTAYNGRIFDAMIEENKPFEIVWDGQISTSTSSSSPRAPRTRTPPGSSSSSRPTPSGSPTRPTCISYGPARKSSAPMVGKFKDGTTDMAPHMPTTPSTWPNALHHRHRVLGRPRHRAERALQRLARQLTPAGAAGHPPPPRHREDPRMADIPADGTAGIAEGGRRARR